MYKLSVIIPVYNTEKYLEKCVESVLKQSLESIEIILVDDESPDKSGELCDLLAKKHPNVKVIHKKNSGLGMARNSGIEIASGEYIAFLDSDDYVSSDYYQVLTNTCENNACDICYGNGYIFFDERNTEEVLYSSSEELVEGNDQIKKIAPRIIGTKPCEYDLLTGTSTFAVYRRKFLIRNDIRFISERSFISEDIWFNLTCFEVAKKICYAKTTGYFYRYNTNSLSRGYNANRFTLLCSSTKQLLDKCEKMLLADYEMRVAYYFWSNFEKCINQEVIFSGKYTVISINKMLDDSMCNDMLTRIAADKSFKGLHALLCRLLVDRHIRLVIFLLKIYNVKKS